MKNLLPLMHREWLQHRFAWSLMALLPTLIAVLLLSFGEVHIAAEERGDHLPAALTLAALAGGMGLHLVMLWIVALITSAGLARRDHGDRSIEFWLSLPVGHGTSLAVPLLVHLVLVPMAAIAVGLAGGFVASFVLISRVEGAASWFALPWGALVAGGLAIFGRLAVGVVLATLWLSPLLLLTVLLTAWLRRWGLVVLALGLGVGTQVLDKVFGIGWPLAVLGELLTNAGRSVANTSHGSLTVETSSDLAGALAVIPQWAVHDAGQALALMASPVLLGGLLVAAGCFALLVRWRQAGADAGN
jgi:ABC-2 type transport system permease protein